MKQYWESNVAETMELSDAQPPRRQFTNFITSVLLISSDLHSNRATFEEITWMLAISLRMTALLSIRYYALLNL